jgi:hypothetical protein
MTVANPMLETASRLNERIKRRLPTYGWLLLLGLLVLIAYLPGLDGGYIFDDFPNIVDNDVLHVGFGSSWQEWLAAMFSSPASELQRPLAMLTFAVNHAITGLDPYWMKLTNICIHLLNAWLVFGLARSLLRAARRGNNSEPATRQDFQAFWISAAWALNPINLMAVLFIVQRMESLCHTFVLAGLWMYVAGRDRLSRDGRGWGLMASGLIGGTLLGMLAKESAALLPLYALAIEWALLRFKAGETRRERMLRWGFSLAIGPAVVAALAWQLPKVMHAGAYAGRPFTLGERLLTETRVLVDYLYWTLLPNLRALSLYHDDYRLSQGLLAPPSTLVSMLLLAVLVGLAIWLRKRRPLMALGIAWFFIAHLLTATVLPLELVYEHRNYFASLGICIALGDLLLAATESETLRRPGMLIAVLLLVFYAGLTSLRSYEWRDVMHFSVSEEAKRPQSPRATYDLARNLVVASNYDIQSPYFAKAHDALERAMAVPGASTLPATAAIMLAARSGTPLEAHWWENLRQKLRKDPIGPQQTASLASLVNCDLRFSCRLPTSDMMSLFSAALSRGRNAEMLNVYGNYALNRLGDASLALRLWQEAAYRAPKVVQYQVTLAKMYIASGRPDLAQAPIAQLRRLGRLGQNAGAVSELERLSATSMRSPHLEYPNEIH